MICYSKTETKTDTKVRKITVVINKNNFDMENGSTIF